MEALDKRDEILKAAGLCFARYGYEKTTLDDIGRAVGLNKASLYYYFKNKESIYTEVIYTEADAFLNNVMQEVSKVSGCKGKIFTYLSERTKFIKDSINLNQLSEDSVKKITPLFSEMYMRVMEREIRHLAGILENCVQENEIAACDTNRIANSILLITESIRGRIDCKLTSEQVFKVVVDETEFTVSLILEGLLKKEVK